MSRSQPPGRDEAWLLGDDGTGHCRGCKRHLSDIQTDCPVCLAALDYMTATHLLVPLFDDEDDE